MEIVGVNLGQHDGSVALVRNGSLEIHIEAQKDSELRYAPLPKLSVERLTALSERIGESTSLVATSGWFGVHGGYEGCHESAVILGDTDADNSAPARCPAIVRRLVRDRKVRWFATSHERAHVFCAYALSPFPQGQPCYVLLYEGRIGAFYKIDRDCRISRIAEPLSQPGQRYAFLYELADSASPDTSRGWSMNVSGKLMALANSRDDTPLGADEEETMKRILVSETLVKHEFRHSSLFNIGPTHPAFRRFATKCSERLFDRFYTAAKEIIKEKLPLLIAGGCGLNCGWNMKWRDSGLFEDVFIPPCTDDSGVGIGAAADAQRYFSGSAKIRWTPSAGESFTFDQAIPDCFDSKELNLRELVELLQRGEIIPWVQGQYELGPRALGNRSLLAAPFDAKVKDRLNQVKNRESYRPVAPICLEEEAHRWFDWHGSSPYMLFFQKVKENSLAAVTHDDGTARIQTLRSDQNPRLYELLRAFSEATGVGVLCNTSLNFNGRGFINRSSDLVRFMAEKGLRAMVINDLLYVKNRGLC